MVCTTDKGLETNEIHVPNQGTKNLHPKNRKELISSAGCEFIIQCYHDTICTQGKKESALLHGLHGWLQIRVILDFSISFVLETDNS